ncbi:hypothetical protein GE061_001452 [Apolygus lucorum]|uniref:Uncharacterized protein n=1 Tax=Apolygus lucorum TaxID=248454 RepID=A0A6A4KCK6_APOLU|nr:hypothetical protein GE061_001452 [Apolygus lucorum]
MRPPRTVISALLILGFTSFSAAKPFTKEDELKLIKLQPKMKIPKIDEFLESDLKKKGSLVVYTFKYKNYAEDKTCTVVFKQLHKPKDNIESEHKWNCRQYPIDPELVGPDYGSSGE